MNSVQRINQFVTEHLSTASLSEQIEVSLAMAEAATTPAESKRWRSHAIELKAISDRTEQLWLNFRKD